MKEKKDIYNVSHLARDSQCSNLTENVGRYFLHDDLSFLGHLFVPCIHTTNFPLKYQYQTIDIHFTEFAARQISFMG